MSIGCSAGATLSARVKGTLRNMPIFDSQFFPCDEGSFNTAIATLKTTIAGGRFRDKTCQNPFQQHARPPIDSSGRQVGYLRGWAVFDYDTDIVTQRGCGVEIDRPRLTICYKNGVLGAAFRWHTGVCRLDNRLSAFRSMYPERIHTRI